jgi:hypothetical protein
MQSREVQNYVAQLGARISETWPAACQASTSTRVESDSSTMTSLAFFALLVLLSQSQTTARLEQSAPILPSWTAGKCPYPDSPYVTQSSAVFQVRDACDFKPASDLIGNFGVDRRTGAVRDNFGEPSGRRYPVAVVVDVTLARDWESRHLRAVIANSLPCFRIKRALIRVDSKHFTTAGSTRRQRVVEKC